MDQHLGPARPVQPSPRDTAAMKPTPAEQAEFDLWEKTMTPEELSVPVLGTGGSAVYSLGTMLEEIRNETVLGDALLQAWRNLLRAE